MRVLRNCFICVFLLNFNLAACVSAPKNDFTGTITPNRSCLNPFNRRNMKWKD